MLFTIGIENPENEKTAIGLYVPALSNELYSCVSAVDEFNDILPAVTDAIHSVLEDMTETGFDFSTIKDLGVNEYKKQEDYKHCNLWLLVDIDISDFLEKITVKY